MENTEDKKPKNPQAFACAAGDEFLQEGMTLRDYFAAKNVVSSDLELYANKYGQDWAKEVARDSYVLADAMLKAREI